MNRLKKIYNWEKKQLKNPETVLGVWMALGVVFGAGIDNMGAGIAIGVAIGVAMSSRAKKSLEKKHNEQENESKLDFKTRENV